MSSTVAASIQPIITAGRFSTPRAYGVYERTKKSSDAQYQPANHNSATNLSSSAARRDHVNTQAPVDYAWGVFWHNVDNIAELERSELVTNEMDDDEARYDQHGVRLPEPTNAAPKGKMSDIRELFDKVRSQVDASPSPMGLSSPDGLLFKFCWPPGKTGARYIELIHDINAIIRPGTVQFKEASERFTVWSHILPTPVHVSPLALALFRETGECPRFTDAISSVCRLFLFSNIIFELDTENLEHKKASRKHFDRIHAYIRDKFFSALDAILPTIERAQVESRDEREHWVRAAAVLFDQHALALIHALEWYLMDMLRLPYNIRAYLMTPVLLPTAEQAFAGPNQGAYPILRNNLINYTGQRNMIMCGVLNPATNMYTGIHPDAWMPMRLDDPPLVDRAVLLGRWNKDDTRQAQYANRCLFGMHNGWIDLHTLWECARFHTPNPKQEGHLNRRHKLFRDEDGDQDQDQPTTMDQGDD